MLFAEGLQEQKKVKEQLFQKWDKALNAYGGIGDEHKALTTAIVMENYLGHLNDNPQLIAEDKVGTSAIKGVNLALLGLVRRAIPELVGGDLVGMQAMPTPNSPIFTMIFDKSDNKGASSKGDTLWNSPFRGVVGEDPNYSSNKVIEDFDPTAAGSVSGDATITSAGTVDSVYADADGVGVWASAGSGELIGNNINTNSSTQGVIYILPSSVFITFTSASGVTLEVYRFNGSYTSGSTQTVDLVYQDGNSSPVNGDAIILALAGNENYSYDTGSGKYRLTLDYTGTNTVNAQTATLAKFEYEFAGESEGNIPEIGFNIREDTVRLIRRQLRGRYSLDAEYDLKKLHGISLDSEIVEMMKIELMNGINREIIQDLRSMAYTVRTMDFSVGNLDTINVTGNYDDLHRAMLDGISRVAAEIWNLGRLGYGNWVIGNPVTLAFLDRVPGFNNAGADYDGKGLSFAGSLGGRIKFYKDPQYPQDELLVGYKGNSALDTGYVHAMYLPITSTPTLSHPDSGDPTKIFYTRYGKTWQRPKDGTGEYKSLIEFGDRQYARIVLNNFPTIFS